jgi:hypothetical protein
MRMGSPELTPTTVQQTLALLAGLEIDETEAARLVPWIQFLRASMAAIEPFDVGEVRSSLQFDPTSPYR